MRLSLVAVCALSALLGLPAQAEQAFPYKAYVTAVEVYVRSGPGRTFYPTDKLHTGDQVEVYRHDPGGWCAIRPPEGSFSWVSGRDVKLLDDKLAEVAGDRVAARVGSRFSSIRDVIGVRLHGGELVELLDRKQSGRQPGSETWYKIAPPSGEFRWISSRYVSQEPPAGGVRKVASSDDPRARQSRSSSPSASAIPSSQPAQRTANPPNEPAPRQLPSETLKGRQWRPAAGHVEAKVQPERQANGPVASASDPAGPAASSRICREGFLSELDEIDVELSIMLAEEPKGWGLDELRMRTQALLNQAETPLERGRVRLLARRIERAQSIQGECDAVAGTPAATGQQDRPWAEPGLEADVPRTSVEPAVYYDDRDSNQPVSPTSAVTAVSEDAAYLDQMPLTGCDASSGMPVWDANGCCPECTCCGPGGYSWPMWTPLGGKVGTLWVRGEYLLWWLEGFPVPPLVTTSAAEDAGVLGEPTTAILAGNTRLADQARSGGRISFGYWFDSCMTTGVFATYMGLGTAGSSFSASSAGGEDDPVLARPFFNVEAGREGQDAEPVAFPEQWAGNVAVHAETTLQGIEVLGRRCVAQQCWYRMDLLAGWRFNRLDDALLIRDFKESLGAPAVAVGTTFDEFDRFQTRNWFNGGELGLVGEVRYSRWTLELVTKLALGGTCSEVLIDGFTTITVPVPGGEPDVAETPAGLLAQDTNIGVYQRNEFAVIPELSIMLGYDITSNFRAMFGYTFMYWSRVARPGDQIDFDLNLTQLDETGLVGNPRPQFAWVIDDMWAQGLNFALDCRF